MSGETTPYQEIKLYSEATTTRGVSPSVSAGLEPGKESAQVGVARVRALEYDSGVPGNTDAVYKAHLFDIRTFTELTLSDTPSPLLTATHSTVVQVIGIS